MSIKNKTNGNLLNYQSFATGCDQAPSDFFLISQNWKNIWNELDFAREMR